MPAADGRAREHRVVELRRARAHAQLLGADAGSRPAVDVVGHLLAVQAQDGPAAARALTVRGATDLAGEGLVLAWLVRGTLHLVRAEDFAWLHGLTAPTQVAGNARRLAQEGVPPADAERGVAAVLAALAAEGSLPRARVAAALDAAGVRSAGQATPHVLLLAALRGRIAFDPRTREAVAVPEPPGPLEGEARDRALGELARRYLRAHAPADARDLARWAGLPLRDARRGLETLTSPGDRKRPHARVAPRLLGAFDPYLLDWRDRSHAVAARHARAVAPGGGIVRGVATVDGRVVGTWTRREGITWLGRRPSAADRAALEGQRPE